MLTENRISNILENIYENYNIIANEIDWDFYKAKKKSKIVDIRFYKDCLMHELIP